MKPESVIAMQSILKDRNPKPLPPEEQSDPTVVELYACLADLRAFVTSLLEGDLAYSSTHKGYLAGALKSLQANLRHLTWQTKRIAQGDFSQKVDFMGEFSTAFNEMALQLKETREQLEEARRISELRADTDGLTGLYKHVFLMKTLAKETASASRYGHPLSVILLDIDHFKKFNDTYGHQTGDAVLKSVSDILRQSLRQTDTAGRYGGEEFLLILPNTDHAGTMELAERIRHLMETTPHTSAGLKVTISAGVASRDDQKPNELIQQADARMYEAKRNGRNQVSG